MQAQSTMARIYALHDPDGTIRYIGQTTWPLDMRLAAHLSGIRERSAKEAWIAGLLAVGERPTISLLAEVPETEALRLERETIKRYWHEGFHLTNTTHTPLSHRPVQYAAVGRSSLDLLKQIKALRREVAAERQRREDAERAVYRANTRHKEIDDLAARQAQQIVYLQNNLHDSEGRTKRRGWWPW